MLLNGVTVDTGLAEFTPAVKPGTVVFTGPRIVLTDDMGMFVPLTGRVVNPVLVVVTGGGKNNVLPKPLLPNRNGFVRNPLFPVRPSPGLLAHAPRPSKPANIMPVPMRP